MSLPHPHERSPVLACRMARRRRIHPPLLAMWYSRLGAHSAGLGIRLTDQQERGLGEKRAAMRYDSRCGPASACMQWGPRNQRDAKIGGPNASVTCAWVRIKGPPGVSRQGIYPRRAESLVISSSDPTPCCPLSAQRLTATKCPILSS